MTFTDDPTSDAAHKYVVVAGDAWELSRQALLQNVQAIVTSPPYWRQRRYADGAVIQAEFGHESLSRYVERLVELFHALRAVLRPDGAVWLNLGDATVDGSLMLVPSLVATALRQDGWLVISEVIYERENMTPRPVRNRPTHAHETLYLLALTENYYYDADYMREPAKYAGYEYVRKGPRDADGRRRMDGTITVAVTRNMRSVWTGPTGWNNTVKHPALMPRLMAERCVLSLTRPGDLVLDPFCGAGTTGVIALEHRRAFIGWELVPKFVEATRRRLRRVQPIPPRLPEMADVPAISEPMQLRIMD